MKISTFLSDMSFSDEEDDTDEQVSIPGLDHPGALPMMGGHPMGATPPHLTPGNMSDHSSSSAHTLTPTPNKYETNNNSLAQQQPPMVSPLTKEEKDDLDMDDDLKGDGDDDKGNFTASFYGRVLQSRILKFGRKLVLQPHIKKI